VPAPRGRDLELTRRRLRDWFSGVLPDAREIRLSGLAGPATTGFSSDTLLFDLEYRENGRPIRRPLAIRIQPTGFQIFPEYDLGLQFRIQSALAPTSVPTARMYWREQDPGVLDAPFYVMERVDGRIPTDRPPYHTGGWMTEIRSDERTAIWWSGLEVLARIHNLDWEALDLGWLADQDGRTPIERQLDYYTKYLAWTWDEKPHPTCTPALEWLTQNRPREQEPVTLVWGDARIGNMIFQNSQCAAVLDWEMATLGNPEEDLAWWIFLDRHHSEGVGAARLPGFPGREETIARYEYWSGRQTKHLDYYERFAALRFSVIMARVAKQMQAYGELPEDSDFGITNPCSRMLAQLLDLPDPAPSD